MLRKLPKNIGKRSSTLTGKKGMGGTDRACARALLCEGRDVQILCLEPWCLTDTGEVIFDYRPVHMYTLTDEVDVVPPKKRTY